jgi:hypothetical protein
MDIDVVEKIGFLDLLSDAQLLGKDINSFLKRSEVQEIILSVAELSARLLLLLLVVRIILR